MKLPESDPELREFIERAPFGFKWVSPAGRILWANPAELDLVGCSEAESLGRHISEFLVDSEVATQILSCFDRGEAVESYKTQMRGRDGSIKDVLIDGSGLFRDGHLVHSRLMARDITDLVAREESARHGAEASSHLKDEFLALLSHELRTPLGAILVWMGLLKQGGFDAGGQEHALEIIGRSAKSMERIIEDLLHSSRIAAGGLTLNKQTVDFQDIVQLAVDSAVGDAAKKGVALAWTPCDGPVTLSADPGRLQQAVANLLSNAIKFTPEAGSVKIDMKSVNGQATLRVRDTGEGMSSTFLPFAFERSRQQDATSTRAHHGLGLGLFVVRHVIEGHGGVVNAESKGPGMGSLFTVQIPLAKATSAESHVAGPVTRVDPEVGASAGLSVLVVDDEEDVRDALRLILQQNGIAVTTAASTREAFDLLVRSRPDILLSDIGMPGEDGLSFIRRVRLLPPLGGGLISAVALSAYASPEDRTASLLAGFQCHLAKPVDPVHLLDVLAGMPRNNHHAGAA